MIDIEQRITAAIERITSGNAPMRVPADETDPDLVLADCLAEIRRLRAALSARQPAYVQGCDELRARTEGERAAYMEGLEEGKKIAARQPVGEPVADAGRSAAYDAIDRFLRNNMDDEAYAAYAEHLEALWAAVPAQSVNTPQPVAFDYPKFKAVGMGCVLEDRGVHFLIDAAQCGFDEALGQMKATLESIGPLYAAPPAQAVDLGQFREVVSAMNTRLQSVIGDNMMPWSERDKASKEQAALYPLLALIDSDAKAQAVDLANVIDQIAQQWDGCSYDAVGETIDVGQAIRAAWKRLLDKKAAANG